MVLRVVMRRFAQVLLCCGFGVVVVLLVGCVARVGDVAPTLAPARVPTVVASLAPSVTMQPTVELTPDEQAVMAGIQGALDRYARAYNTNDIEVLRRVLDVSNAPFSRFVATRFQEYQRGFLGGSFTYHFTVAQVRPRDFGFVQAQVRTDGGYVSEWLFRRVDGVWLLSEPTVEQIGAEVVVRREHFLFHTYPWADDVNARIIALMEQARARVLERLGRAPDQVADVDIRPIYGLTPFDNPGSAAYYEPRSGAHDRIAIYAPNAYNFGFYDARVGWEAELLGTLTHEFTHMVHKRSFDNVGQLSDWMVEGLAEFVAGNDRRGEVQLAVRQGALIPIIDTKTAVYKQDLMHLAALEENKSLAYGLAYSLVAYINEVYGGMDGFWRLARAYESRQDLDAALRESFGVSYEQFDRDWRVWLQRAY